jgi:NTE family protein
MSSPLREFLADAQPFGPLSAGAVDDLVARARMIELRSGDPLYRSGEASTDAYVVVRGRLVVTDGERLIGYVGRGEPAGEMGAVTGEPRSATVAAVRDTVVLAWPRTDLLAFLHDNPDAMLSVARLVIGRLREQGRHRMQSATEQQGTFAVIPASADVPVLVLAEELVRRLGGWPQARLVTAEHVDAALGEGASLADNADRQDTGLRDWLGRLEARHRYVVYAAATGRDAWALRCLHSADRVLLLAEAGQPPSSVPVVEELARGGLLSAVELILLRPEGDPSPYTLQWREAVHARAHYFVHPWDERELASLSRQVTGRGVGLVLGGGGARGFAHIGLVRALAELQVPVDVVGGTSIGAFLAALIACGFDDVEMRRVARDTFVRANYLNDYTIPRFALIRGHKFIRRLQEIFGERQIEDLRRGFFCVSANLTTGATVVNDRGPLATWVGTSMSIPGVGPPVAWHGHLLCDGGVVDNLPTDVMQGLERGSIIASNVSTAGGVGAPGAGLPDPDPLALANWNGEGDAPRLLSILVRSATLTSSVAMSRAIDLADVVLHQPCDGVGLFDWKRLDELVQRGYEYSLETLGPLRDALMR